MSTVLDLLVRLLGSLGWAAYGAAVCYLLLLAVFGDDDDDDHDDGDTVPAPRLAFEAG